MPAANPRVSWTTGLLALATVSGLVCAPPAGAVAGAEAKNGDYAFTAKLTIGDSDRACTGVLVDAQWVLSAASCFADNPQQPSAVQAGAPTLKTVATIGRTDLSTTTGRVVDVVELVPHADRDVALAKLAQPVTGITPVKLATKPPVVGETLHTAGYGRTHTEWVPNRLHTAGITVQATDASSLSFDSTTPGQAAVCKGDSGGPALREHDGVPELVAVNSRSWQGGCLGETETRTSGLGARTDNITNWIRSTAFLGQNVTPVTAVDYDQDKVADLFVKNPAGDLFVMSGKKGGGFTNPRPLATGWDFPQTVGADFTSDGIGDLITVSNRGDVLLLVGQKSGDFVRGKKITDGWNFTQTTAGDFDGDGKADLIAKDTAGNLYRWPGNGDGTFNKPVKVTGGWDFRQTVGADFTGDRIADLIAANTSIELFEWSGRSGGSFTTPTKLTDDWNYTHTTAGDFDGDGKADLIAKDTAGTLYLWTGNGNATFNKPVKLAGNR